MHKRNGTIIVTVYYQREISYQFGNKQDIYIIALNQVS